MSDADAAARSSIGVGSGRGLLPLAAPCRGYAPLIGCLRRLAAAEAVGPADVVIVDGVYSARPELADLVDVRVLLEVPADVRSRRLATDATPWIGTSGTARSSTTSADLSASRFDLRLSAGQLRNDQNA